MQNSRVMAGVQGASGPAPSSDVRTGVRASRTASQRRDSSPRPHLVPLRQLPQKSLHVSLSRSTCARRPSLLAPVIHDCGSARRLSLRAAPPFCLHHKRSPGQVVLTSRSFIIDGDDVAVCRCHSDWILWPTRHS